MRNVFYEEKHWEKAAKTKMSKYLTETETHFILHAVNLSKCTLTMDVGAEGGRFSLLAATENVEVIGVTSIPAGSKG